MKHIKYFLLTLLATLFALPATSQDFEYEGIWYTVLDAEAKTVKTRDGSFDYGTQTDLPGNTISGDMSIPSQVSDGNVSYTVVRIGNYSFASSTDLTSIDIPESVKSIGEHAFARCAALASVFLPDQIGALEVGVFDRCTSLTSITLPNTITSIKDCAFINCRNLMEINIPAAVDTIGVQAFFHCSSLTSIYLPSVLTSVGEYAFMGCNRNIIIDYDAIEPIATYENIFDESTYASATLNMPNATLATVQATEPWNKFARIKASDGSVGFVAVGDRFEYEGIWYNVVDADAKTCETTFSTEEGAVPYEGDIRIPTEVTDGRNSFSVVGIGAFSFQKCSALTSVSLPETVRYIERYAFDGCSELTYVDVSENLTTISQYAFNSCKRLLNLTFPETLTSIEQNAFRSCHGLTSISLPSSLTELGEYAFAYCEGLMTFSIPESITEIPNGLFQGCSGLNSFELNEGVTAIGIAAFGSCTGLISVNLPNSLESISSSAFSNCKSLKSIILPEKLTYLGHEAFKWCDGLVSVDMPESLKSIEENTFKKCTSLKSVKLSSKLTRILTSAFEECTSLQEISLPDSLEYIGLYTFYQSGLKSVSLPNNMAFIGLGAFRSCRQLQEVSFPENLPEPKYIGENSGVFTFCDAITTVNYSAAVPEEIPSQFNDVVYQNAVLNAPNATLSDIESTSPWNKFLRINAKDGSIGLVADGDEFEYQGMTYTVIVAEDRTVRTKVNWYHHTAGIPDEMFTEDFEIPAVVNDGINDYTVIEIGAHTFDGCEPLTAIKLPETIKTIDMYAFEGCIHLNSIDIPDGVMYIGTRAFASCSSLHSVEIPASVTGMGESVFRECKSLQEAILPDGLITIPVEMFHDCANLVSVNYPSSLISIRDYAFYGCQSLTSVMLPESLTSIGVLAFTGCLKFKELSLPDSLEEIGEKAFWGCDLTTLTLPASLTSIGSAAFDRNQNIAEVTYNATQPITAPEDIFDTETADIYATATLKTPNATLEAVQATVPWNKFLRITASNDSIVPFVTEIILTKTFAELKVGETLAIEATLLPANATDKRVTWTSDKPEIAKVDSVGKVTAIALGEATITATCGEVNATCKVTVVPTPVAGITLSAESLDLIEGDSAKLTVTLVPEDATDQTVTWTSSDEAVATVSADGEVTAVSPGTVAVSATTSNGLTATCTVTVEARIIDATGLTLNTTTAELKVGESVSLEATVIPEDATDKTVTWASDNAEVAIVDADGMVTAIALGQANITATCGEVSATCKVTVVPTPVESITLSTASLTLLEGEAATLTATVSPEDATDKRVTWTTSDASVATVSADGVVTAVKVGTATVTATAANGMTATCNVKVYLNNGGEFEYGGLSYTVTDAEEHTVKTKAGNPEEGMAGNTAEGDLVIPSTVTVDGQEYTVTEIGDYGFSGNSDLLSVTIPGTITNIGEVTFSDCERLTSLIWLGNAPLQSGVVEGIGNPNLLVYVNSPEAAPEGMGHNVVVGSDCDNLVLTPGYPFYPAETFFSRHSEMTKSFTQQTPIGGSAGWETLAVPFHPTSIKAADGRALVSFRMLTDITSECPFWLYEADPDGEWMAADSIRQGVPFLISMPNNDEYDVQYRVEGAVTFVSDEYTLILPKTCTPYVTTWASGREFRSLWLPLTEAEAAEAMGLNVGVTDLTDDDGHVLLPGSAFHADVLPLPMEAYVSRIDSRRAMPVRGGQNFVGMMAAEGGLRIAVDLGSISILSDHDRTLDVVSPDGVAIKRAHVKAGKEYRIEHLTRGIYIVAGRKITVK